MALYLGGSEKLKVNFAGSLYNLIIPTPLPVLSNTILLSFDNYILKDSNGLYLTVKESE